MGSNKVTKKAEKKQVEQVKKQSKKVESSDGSSSESSDSSDSSDSEEEKKDSSDSEEEKKDSSDSSDSEEEKTEEKIEVPQGQKRKAEEDEQVYTIWVGALSYQSTAEDVQEFFSDCGEIKDVRVRMDDTTGKNRGFCHVDFATKEGQQAALAKTNLELDGRRLRVDAADGSTRTRAKDENYSKAASKVFVANLNRDYDEDQHRSGLAEVFAAFGTIVGDIRIPTDRESGQLKGIGYIEFENKEQAEAAVKGMNGVEFNGRPLRTDFAGERPAGNGGRGGGRGGFRGGRGGGFRGGNDGGFRGGRGGGFRGGRGGSAPRGSYQKF